MRRMMVLGVLVAVLLSSAGAASPATQGGWVITDLGTLGGPVSSATDINERGQVVGQADTRVKDKDGDPIRHAILWQDGKMRDLGTLGGLDSSADALNDRGQVVRYANIKARSPYDGDQLVRAFLWENGKMRSLGTWIAAAGGYAEDINERGQVVGDAGTAATVYGESGPEHIRHAFVWENGKARDLGTLGGIGDTGVRAINESGQIVGDSSSDSEDYTLRHAVLWTYKP